MSVFDAVQRAWDKCTIGIDFKRAFTCECVSEKQDWLLFNDLRGGHLFTDITALGVGGEACCCARRQCT